MGVGCINVVVVVVGDIAGIDGVDVGCEDGDVAVGVIDVDVGDVTKPHH